MTNQMSTSFCLFVILALVVAGNSLLHHYHIVVKL